ncbi:VC0807 family protein [Pseudonocardia sp. GCM10023141]|uniref:VC0807 family protein n=1 Tax=Pseudonocardia sp. GCM10023141 TaxID=3252653 RepID=UPI00360DFE8D
MTGAAAAEPGHSFDSRSMLLNLALTAIFDIGLAIVAFNVASSWGASDQVAYLISGIGPLVMIVITWIRARKLSGASIVILVFLLLSSAAAFIGGSDSRLLIVKDSVVTGGFGLACLLSVLLAKPLMFYFGAKFATDGTREGLDRWYGLWQYPDFRRSQYLVNAVWGIGFLVEAGLRILVAYTVASFDTAYTISTILPFVFLAGLITFTMVAGMRTRNAAAARIANTAAR